MYVVFAYHLRHMIQRLVNFSKSNSFFLFGARGTGKTTWLKETFNAKNTLWFDLLDAKTDLELKRDPDLILKRWKALVEKPKYIIIDEIQKNSSLLDVVHKGIEDHKIKFILTGSSARKLKRGASNLLAGRAFEFHVFPFSFFELKEHFNLQMSLQYGLLPKLFSPEAVSSQDKERFLYSYISTYLKEEILQEQIIRNLDPFQKFLEVAAQANGKILNYSKIAKNAGIDPKQVERYFPILIETLVGFFLEPYHRSVRKRQTQKSKFYFFDMGVARTLANRVTIAPVPNTFEYGDLFEQFIILEFIKLNHYLETRFKLSYLRLEDDSEIDLIIEKPNGEHILIEIKSSVKIDLDEVKKMTKFKPNFKKVSFYYLSQDEDQRLEHEVFCLPWQEGIMRIFKPPSTSANSRF